MPSATAGKVHVLVTVPMEASNLDRIRAVAPNVSVAAFHRPPRSTAVFPSDREREALPDDIASWFRNAEVLFGFFGQQAQRSLNQLGPLAKIAPNLRWIQLTATGTDHLAMRKLHQTGVAITTIGGALSPVIAEYVLAGVLALLKNLPDAVRAQEHQTWERYNSSELNGKCVCIVGYGRIGTAVAAIMRPFGCSVLAVRRDTKKPTSIAPDALFDQSHLREAISAADIVVLAVPATSETHEMFGRNELAAMKRSAILVNVARGTIIDEMALVDALQSRRIRGAVLDVFREEPLAANHPLWRQKNALITPHVAAGSDRYDELAVECFVQNLQRYLRGEPLLHQARADS